MKAIAPLTSMSILFCGALCAQSTPSQAFPFDHDLYLQFGRIALERLGPAKFSQDWSNPTFASAIDGHGRKFVYVGFPGMQSGSAADVVFEICVTSNWPALTMSSSQLDLKKSREEFLRIAGNRSADYPHGCNESRRED